MVAAGGDEEDYSEGMMAAHALHTHSNDSRVRRMITVHQMRLTHNIPVYLYCGQCEVWTLDLLYCLCYAEQHSGNRFYVLTNTLRDSFTPVIPRWYCYRLLIYCDE